MIFLLFLAALATSLVLARLTRRLRARGDTSSVAFALVRSTQAIVVPFAVVALVFSALSLYAAWGRGENETKDRLWVAQQRFEYLQKAAAAAKPSAGVALIVLLVLFALSASLAVTQRGPEGRLARLARGASNSFRRYSKIVGMVYWTLCLLCSFTFFAGKFDEGAGGELRLRFKALDEETRKAGAGVAEALAGALEDEAVDQVIQAAPPELEKMLEREEGLTAALRELERLKRRAAEVGVEESAEGEAEAESVMGVERGTLEEVMEGLLGAQAGPAPAQLRAGPGAHRAPAEERRARGVAELTTLARISADGAAITTESLGRLKQRVRAVLESPERRAVGKQSISYALEMGARVLGDVFPAAQVVIDMAGEIVTETLHPVLERKVGEPLMRGLWAAGLGEADGALEEALNREAERLVSEKQRLGARWAELWPPLQAQERRVQALRLATNREIEVSRRQVERAERWLEVRREATLRALERAIDRLIAELWPERRVSRLQRGHATLRAGAIDYRDALLEECRSQRLTLAGVQALQGLLQVTRDSSRPAEERFVRIFDFGENIPRPQAPKTPFRRGAVLDPDRERDAARTGVQPRGKSGKSLREWVNRSRARGRGR